MADQYDQYDKQNLSRSRTMRHAFRPLAPAQVHEQKNASDQRDPGARRRYLWPLAVVGVLLLVSLVLVSQAIAASQRLIGHTAPVTSTVVSPDGHLLASAAGDTTIRLWDADTGQTLYTLRGHTDWVFDLALSPDGTQLASASWDHTVSLWDTRSGELLATHDAHKNLVWDVAFSPDGSLLASAGEDGIIRLWRTQGNTDKPVRVLRDTDGAVYSVAFSPDGQTLVSGGSDEQVRVWRVADGTMQRALFGHSGNVLCVTFSPDGSMIASGAADGTVKLWRASDGALLHTLEGHPRRVFSVAFSPDGTQLASSGANGRVLRWRVADGTLLHSMTVGEWSVRGCHADHWLAELSACRLNWGTHYAYTVSFTPDGEALVFSDGNDVRLQRL